MKILHVKAGDRSLETDNRFADLVKALTLFDIDQRVLMAADKAREEAVEALGIPCHVEKFGGMFDLRTQQATQQILESYRPHLIQLHTRDSSSVLTKISHDSICVGFADNAADKKQKAGADISLAVSHSFREDPMDYDILPVPPLVYNDNGNIKAAARSAYDTPDDKPLIGTMIDLDAGYDLDKIFQAIKEIGGLHFWVIGSAAHKSAVETQARKKAVQDKVRFIEASDQWPSLLKALDLCVVPQRLEGADRLTLEAWSCGVPVLSAMPASRSPINNNEDGWLLPANDRLKWSENLKGLLEETVSRDAQAKAGQERYRKSYSAEHVIRNYLGAYETALKVKV